MKASVTNNYENRNNPPSALKERGASLGTERVEPYTLFLGPEGSTLVEVCDKLIIDNLGSGLGCCRIDDKFK
jgi:hypothetical protein